MFKSSPQVALHYADYLKLAGLLSAQQPESARHGRPAHDEMLFIIVHQTYELWFKQILHELDRIQVDFGGEVVEDEYLGRIVHGLERINEILKLLIQQLEVLETMTPLEYRKAVKQMLEDDAARVRANAAMGPQQREAEAKRIEASLEEFQAIFAQAPGPAPWQMSRAAVQAALFIVVYRDRPVLQLPFRLLAALMNVDELLTLWRYRHALMVQRMIGVKIGTGGSAGHDYLRETAAKHRIFSDLFRLSTYLIPRSRLPKLPRELEDAMGYRYAARPSA